MSRLIDMLGIRVPIVQAPMGGAVTPDLAAAVSNAGGLGTLPLWSRSLGDSEQQILRMRQLTNGAFAVNLNMDFPMEELLDLCLALEVPIISFFWKDPGALVGRAKDRGALVIHTVGSAEAARRAVDAGVDIVVAQGWEAGGHVRGKVATMALIPAVVDAVGGVPVIAAGGISDGRGYAAAMALGASGIWVGTRFLMAKEAAIHPYYRSRLQEASENDTAFFDDLWDRGWPDAPHRVLRNSTIAQWEAAGRPTNGARPRQDDVIGYSPASGPVYRYQPHTPGAYTTGDIEAMSMWAGQGVGLARKVQSAGEIISDFQREARLAARRFQG